MRIVLATVSWRFGSWGLVIKLIFCSDFGFVWPPQTNFRFPSVGSFSGAHPSFWPFWEMSPIAIKRTLNFGPWSMNLGGTVQALKNDQKWQRTWSLSDYGETAIFTFYQKVFFVPKKRFFSPKKNTRNLLKDWYLFGKRVIFYLHNFSQTWPEHSVPKEVSYFWAWNLGFRAESPFLP